VFNVLLQMLDDGRVTDSQGRVVSFRNSIVILTSNIGSSFILEEETPGAARERVMAAVRFCYVVRADCCSLALEADASWLP
jgi:ATP-dependent Clp protease ATP-binding subunit ClpB